MLHTIRLDGDLQIRQHEVRERERLNTLIQKGTSAVRQVLKARILLKADASEAAVAWSDGEIAEALDTNIDTIARTRQQLVEKDLDAARKRIFDSAAEAKLIALAGSLPPKGGKRWTLTMLETAVRAAEHCRSRQRQYDRAEAQKNILKPHLQKQWVIPPEANAAFVASMEDVLEVYQRPHDPDRPDRLPGRDDEATHQGNALPQSRQGQASPLATTTSAMAPPICSCCLPHWRGGGNVEVTDRHAALDYAQGLKDRLTAALFGALAIYHNIGSACVSRVSAQSLASL